MSECLLTVDNVRGAFIAAPPVIQKEIRDFSFNVPNFFVDLPKYEVWPLGEGTTKVELDFRGSLPEIEQGFGKWGRVGGQVGCDPAPSQGCGYNMTRLKGYGIQQKVVHPMSRELVTDAFCIKDIQTTLQYKQVFAKLIENIQRQVSVFKEYNVVFNYLTLISKKYVVDSGGLKPNTEDPYVYRALGTKQVSNLNPYILDEFYQWLSRMPGVEPIAYENNQPLFAVAASSQVFNRMYLDNPKLREDLRFSGYANDILTKYNFISKIAGQFIPVSIQWPRRFNITPVTGVPVVVPPWVNDVPANYGTFSDLNPAYLEATHEEVLIFGKTPFTIYTMPTETNLGNGAAFGPEPSYFDYWEWVNPKTDLDPLQRYGYFISAATIGLSSTYSEGIYGLLVERPKANTIATFFAAADCPPDPVDCDNEVPAVGCPCPFTLSVSADPFNANKYNLVLSGSIDAVATDDILLATTSGGYITVTVAAITSDGKTVQVTSTEDLTDYTITGIYCDDTLGCSSNVLEYAVNCSDATRLDLILANPIKGNVGQTITAFYGDGSSATVTIISIDMITNTWVVDVGSSAFCDQVGGVVRLCVPPGTDATCPSCAGPTITQCS